MSFLLEKQLASLRHFFRQKRHPAPRLLGFRVVRFLNNLYFALIPKKVYCLSSSNPKNLIWVGSTKKDLTAMPDDVKDVFGFALHLAQTGEKHDKAKPLKGFGGAGVLEVVERDSDGTYRAVYTINYGDSVYVLHCFQKKSAKGIATPKPDIDTIKERLKAAKKHAEGGGK